MKEGIITVRTRCCLHLNLALVILTNNITVRCICRFGMKLSKFILHVYLSPCGTGPKLIEHMALRILVLGAYNEF